MTKISYLEDIYEFGQNKSLASFEKYEEVDDITLFGFPSYMFPKEKYLIVDLNECISEILIRVSRVGFLRGRVLEIFEDEHEQILKFLEKTPFPFKKAFFKLQYFSPKDSLFWKPPFSSWEELLKPLVTSGRTSASLTEKNGNQLIIMEWNEHWKEENEFRVFVWKNHITAISQYVYTEDYHLENKFNLYKLANEIQNYFKNTIQPNFKLDNFVFDIHVDENYVIEFIEFNEFQISGTSCFNWKHDREIIMNEKEEIEIRITKPSHNS